MRNGPSFAPITATSDQPICATPEASSVHVSGAASFGDTIQVCSGGPASGHSGSRLAAEVFRSYPAGIDQVSARHTKGSVASSRAGKEGANALESFAECFSA